jgi:dCTP deaminase
MILTGEEIINAREAGGLVIEPYAVEFVEPNSYAFHLGDEIVEYTGREIDSRRPNSSITSKISLDGMVLYPNRFYLGHTHERIGGIKYAAELYANLSTAALGIWVQTSAPLGHVGAVIHWTLEICVAHPVRIYPRMRLGKICFWSNAGEIINYRGKYTGSVSAVSSRLFHDK